jgi:hypothetical protein
LIKFILKINAKNDVKKWFIIYIINLVFFKIFINETG